MASTGGNAVQEGPPEPQPALDAYLRAARSRHLAELCELIAIPSVGALPEHGPDMARAAAWIAARLDAIGCPEAAVCPTAGHPAVIGRWPAPPGAPTVLVYAHYDVQPADPLELWTTPPFAPEVRGGRLYGRGASDDKGNLLLPLRAIEALTSVEGGLPVGVTFLCEGEEEIGSPSLPALLSVQRERLRADVALSADGIMWSSELPSLLVGSKGLLALDVQVRCAAGDLHSGLHGGMAPNAAVALAHVLARLVAADGEILVEGFADDARPLSDAERAEVARAPFDARAYAAGIGASALVGEPGYTPLERNWHRPTLDVNGIWGGFQGEGAKTVIPAGAGAKITCRLACGQDPDRVAAAIERHVQASLPPGAEAEVVRQAGGSPAFEIDPGHPVLAAARGALRASYGFDPLLMRMGGTLPIAELLQRELGLDVVLLSWSMPDEGLHAPDEFVRLENLDRGARVYADLLHRLAAAGAASHPEAQG
jgi:acetylornithine deacetylase/succinyl-diaminopimelate desuccinylase-like protein